MKVCAPSRIPCPDFPQKDIGKFIERPELVEILESADMGGIICEHLVEEQVAVLETSGMDRNNQHSFIIARIGSDQPVSRSDAGKNHLGAADKRLRIIDNGKDILSYSLNRPMKSASCPL